MKGEINVTVRSEDPKTIAIQLATILSDIQKQVIFQGAAGIKPTVNIPPSGEDIKQCSCGFDMEFVPAKGTVSARYKCTNVAHTTLGKDGKPYRFAEWVK